MYGVFPIRIHVAFDRRLNFKNKMSSFFLAGSQTQQLLFYSRIFAVSLPKYGQYFTHILVNPSRERKYGNEYMSDHMGIHVSVRPGQYKGFPIDFIKKNVNCGWVTHIFIRK